MTAGEIKNNIENYRENSRPEDAQEGVDNYALDNPDEYQAAKEADSQQHALHDPDCVIGGYGCGVTGCGDGDLNSSIGSQNKHRQDKIYDAVKDLSPDSNVEFDFKLVD